MRISHRSLIAALILSLLVPLGAVYGETVFKFGVDTGSIGTLDPLFATQAQNKPVVSAIFDTLVKYDLTDPTYETILPALATSWTVSEDGLTVSLQLREGVQFQDGYGEVTSADVAYSLTRMADPEKSALARYFPGGVSAETNGPYEVLLHLSSPNPLIMNNLALYSYVLCKSAIEEMGEENIGTTPVGSGPYELDSLGATDQIVLIRNEAWWGPQPDIDRIEYKFIADGTTRELAFLNGDLDAIRGLTDALWLEKMANTEGVIVDIFGPDAYFPIIFNLRIAPFDDLLVRKALAYAMDSDAIAEFAGDFASVNKLPVPAGYIAAATEDDVYIPPYYYQYDPALAQDLLAQAGYPNGFEFTTTVSDRSLYYDRMVMIQEMFKQVGVTMNLTVVAHSVIGSHYRSGENPLIIGGSRRFDARTILMDFYHSRGVPDSPTAAFNYGFYENAVVDALLDIADTKSTLAEAKPYWVAAEQLIMADLPHYPLYQSSAAVLVRHSYVDAGEIVISSTTGYPFELLKINR